MENILENMFYDWIEDNQVESEEVQETHRLMSMEIQRVLSADQAVIVEEFISAAVLASEKQAFIGCAKKLGELLKAIMMEGEQD